ncbi:hypothetical protein [Paenibacillus methanolicus]|uniref:Glycosyltransferase RgtA/B/C/D-like domain-containing protein n=1 Tax=Paenibacillus methanolicus TaxID=582686 RepID=A0A5S5BT30_9BACL|nr:hypothetical protein [Paenibacillus methanolicus]TYP70094.1 hypothetical protein BCM02_11272 [Paenibacillus methanolicus]
MRLDYSSFGSQLYAITHYAFACAVLFLLWPRLFLRAEPGDRLAGVYALFMKAACVYIVMVYALVALKLYEFMAVAAVLVMLSARRLWQRGGKQARADLAQRLRLRFYALFDGGLRLGRPWRWRHRPGTNGLRADNRGEAPAAVGAKPGSEGLRESASDIRVGESRDADVQTAFRLIRPAMKGAVRDRDTDAIPSSAGQSANGRRSAYWRRGLRDWLPSALLLAVLAAGAYIRFYDAVTYAAPALSDGAVTLAWMKYINARVLFHDGLYPQGFHITLSLLSKFAAIDPLYVLKYTGPLCGVLTAAGFYFVLSRLTGSAFAGIAGAAVCSFGGPFLFGGDWERQAATNSQEFAFVFVFPSLYFLLRYLKTGARPALRTALAGLAAAGFAHTLAFAYAGMGVGVCLIAAMLMKETRRWRTIAIAALAAAATAVATYAPIQIGLWLGVPMNTSAAEFLTSTTVAAIPALTGADKLGLAALAIMAGSLLIGWRRRERRLAEWFALGIGTASFLLYYIAPYLTGSVVLASRTQALWALGICFSAGFAWWSAWRTLGAWRLRPAAEAAAAAVCLLVVAGTLRLGPIVTYKMDWESMFRQYLRIAGEEPLHTWTMFSQEEGYSLAYGIGWHQYVRTLVDEYDPALPPLTRYGQNVPDPNLTSTVFIVEEKQVFRVPDNLIIYAKLAEERYAKHEEEQRLLADWLRVYSAHHGAPAVFYEDAFIRIRYIERPEAKDKNYRRLWGSAS